MDTMPSNTNDTKDAVIVIIQHLDDSITEVPVYRDDPDYPFMWGNTTSGLQFSYRNGDFKNFPYSTIKSYYAKVRQDIELPWAVEAKAPTLPIHGLKMTPQGTMVTTCKGISLNDLTHTVVGSRFIDNVTCKECRLNG